MVRILAKGILLLKGSEEILRLRTVACSKVLQFLENVFEELQLLVRENFFLAMDVLTVISVEKAIGKTRSFCCAMDS